MQANSANTARGIGLAGSGRFGDFVSAAYRGGITFGIVKGWRASGVTGCHC